MRQIQRLREAIDENDGEDIRAVFADLKVRHPRKERAERGEKNKPGLDHDTEIVYLHDGKIDHYLTAGSYYGVVDHVARWLHAYGYRGAKRLDVVAVADETLSGDGEEDDGDA